MPRIYTPSEIYNGHLTLQQLQGLKELANHPEQLVPGVTVADLRECIAWFEARIDKIRHQVYTHRGWDGIIHHIDVTELRFAIEDDPSIARFTEAVIGRSNYEHLLANGGIEEPHIERIKNDPFRFMPVIWGEMGDKDQYQVLIDGSHRVVRNYRDGYGTARGWLVPRKVWSRYLVHFPAILEAQTGRFLEHAEENSKRQAQAREKAQVHKTVIHR